MTRDDIPLLWPRSITGLDEGEGATGALAYADGFVGTLPTESFHDLGQALCRSVGLALDGHSEDGVEEATRRYAPFVVAVGSADQTKDTVLSGGVLVGGLAGRDPSKDWVFPRIVVSGGARWAGGQAEVVKIGNRPSHRSRAARWPIPPTHGRRYCRKAFIIRNFSGRCVNLPHRLPIVDMHELSVLVSIRSEEFARCPTSRSRRAFKPCSTPNCPRRRVCKTRSRTSLQILAQLYFGADVGIRFPCVLLITSTLADIEFLRETSKSAEAFAGSARAVTRGRGFRVQVGASGVSGCSREMN